MKGNSKVFDSAYGELIESEHITCTPGGRNGQAKMTALGPTYWKTVGKVEPAPRPTTRPNPTNCAGLVQRNY